MYGMYPPPYGWGYPPQQNTVTPDIEARAYKIAVKLATKEKRREEKKKDNEVKAKAEEKKKYEERKYRNFTVIEWYVLGMLSYPFVGPLYQMVTHSIGVK